MVCTLSKISHVVSMISHYMHDPEKGYWQVDKWILRCILGTIDSDLKFEGDKMVVSVVSDNVDDRDKFYYSTSCLFTFAKAKALMSWRSTLQSTVPFNH